LFVRFSGEVFVKFATVESFVSIDVSRLEGQIILAFGLELVKRKITILVAVMVLEGLTRFRHASMLDSVGRQHRNAQ